MATIMAVTSLDLTEQAKTDLLDGIGTACAEVFTNYSVYLDCVRPSMVVGGAKDQITFFVYVPPIDIDRRRKLITKLNDLMLERVGYKGELKVIVIFKYHEDDSVGVDGVLRADKNSS